MIADVIYVLCAVTSITCMVMLFRAYARTKVRLLFWSAWCFAFFAVNNVFLVIDNQVPSIDFSLFRTGPSLIGIALLVYGLLKETTA